MNNHSNSNSKIVLTCAWHSSKHLTSLHSCSNSIRCRLILFSCVDEVFKAGKGSETCLASHKLQVIGSEFSHRAFFAPHRGLSSICSWNFLVQVLGGWYPSLLWVSASGQHSHLLLGIMKPLSVEVSLPDWMNSICDPKSPRSILSLEDL